VKSSGELKREKERGREGNTVKTRKGRGKGGNVSLRQFVSAEKENRNLGVEEGGGKAGAAPIRSGRRRKSRTRASEVGKWSRREVENLWEWWSEGGGGGTGGRRGVAVG